MKSVQNAFLQHITTDIQVQIDVSSYSKCVMSYVLVDTQMQKMLTGGHLPVNLEEHVYLKGAY